MEIRERLALPERCWTGISDAGPAVVDAVRRRSAADSTGDVAGIEAGGHAVRAGRAVDRPASAAIPTG